MAILKGTSASRFPTFSEPNTGAGMLLERGQRAVKNFLNQGLETFESKFVEDGVQNVPGFSTNDKSYGNVKQPSRRTIISQRPQYTVLVKKKMFSTLKSHYDSRYMNDEEKVFISAVKRLFERKAHDISFYESLLTVEHLFDSDGFLSIDNFANGALSALFTVLDGTFNISGDAFAAITGRQFSVSYIAAVAPGLAPYAKLIESLLELQKINNRSKGNTTTTWIDDSSNPDNIGVGPGVGVLELTSIIKLHSNVGIDKSDAGFTMVDPYRVSVITDVDIEIALGEAIGANTTNTQNSRATGNKILKLAELYDSQLNELRRARDKSEVNFQYLLSEGSVIGTILQSGEEFSIFTMSNLSPLQAFNSSEAALAREIIKLMDQYKSAEDARNVASVLINNKYDSVRTKLRNEFVGHCIIQQMDAVHMFINSKTRTETPGSEQSLDTTINTTLKVQEDAFSIHAIRAEYDSLVKGNWSNNLTFPLYLAMRDRSQFRSDGIQVFSGLVDTISTSYESANAEFNVSVGCKSNMEFLSLSRYNKVPSLAQPKGSLMDPLTPFDLKTEAGTGLISTDIKLSEENLKRIAYLKYDDGTHTGKSVTEENVEQDRELGGLVRVFQHAPGLNYKWKEGMLSETQNVSIRKNLDAIGSTISDISDTYGISKQENPFGGLDSADVISILISGQPHNYSTFLKHSMGMGSFTLDNKNQNKFYFNYLFDFFERKSGILGDFIPAKPAIIDPVVAKEAYRQKKKFDNANNELLRVDRKLADIQDKIAKLTDASTLASGSFNSLEGKLEQDRVRILEELRLAQAGAQRGSNITGSDSAISSLGIAGNESVISFKDTEIPNKNNILAYTVKRKPEEVRYNLDKNYLLISDEYDSDLDIQAFIKSFATKLNLFDSTYEKPLDLCMKAAKTVGFELYADSQGNINFKPPGYNKTPLSLLLKLIRLKKAEGVSYIPEFLMELFKSRTESAKEAIELLELRILEKMFLLGEFPTSRSTGATLRGLHLSLSRPNTFSDWSISTEGIITEANKESIFTYKDQQVLRPFPSSKYGGLSNELIKVRNQIFSITGRIDKIRDPPSNDDLLAAKKEIDKSSSAKGGHVTRVTLINGIAKLVSKRQLMGKAYLNMIKTSKSFDAKAAPTDNDNDLTIHDLIPSSFAAQMGGDNLDVPAFPRFMEKLIENDLNNADGFKSSSRFIIKDDVILSMNIQVKSPAFNRIDVAGNRDFLSGGEKGKLAGMPILWAGSVDFDSWRQYGLRAEAEIFRPDFTNAETQCAPYGIFKLQEERRKIHTASITVIGNEFYQAGDVVYINNRSMLYYVTSVNQNIDIESKFTTTLTLEYGRALGDYIPTTLDVIGKGMLANTRNAHKNIKIRRSATSSNDVVHLATLSLPNYNYFSASSLQSGNAKDEFLSDKSNLNLVRNAVIKAASRVNSKRKGDTRNVRIEVRTYHITETKKRGFGRNRVDDTFIKGKVLGQWTKELISSSIDVRSGSLNESDHAFDIANVIQVPVIDMNKDIELNSENVDLRRFPSAGAWAVKNKYVNLADKVELPLNAVDIFYVIEEERAGDSSAQAFQRPNPSGSVGTNFSFRGSNTLIGR